MRARPPPRTTPVLHGGEKSSTQMLTIRPAAPLSCPLRPARRWLLAAALSLSALTHGLATAQPAGDTSVQQVTITAPAGPAVEKSYRRMQRGMALFEREKAAHAPQASLRFKLLPRKPGTDLDTVRLEIIGRSFDQQVPVAPDHTFVLESSAVAWDEDAVVTVNRRQLSVTWRTEIRTPGGPQGTRRLGDLRLECRVGLEAGLVSNSSPLARLADLFTDGRRYCSQPDTQYLFFAERPLFSVTLVAGDRREVLPVSRLYAGASDDPGLPGDLPYCDCEMLVSRTYFLPLGDTRWPDETRVEFEFMEDTP